MSSLDGARHLSYCLMVLEIHGHINQLIWIFFLMFHRVSWITGGFCVSQDFWTINSTHETGWRPYSPPRTGTHREAWEKKREVAGVSRNQNGDPCKIFTIKCGIYDLVKGKTWWLQKCVVFFVKICWCWWTMKCPVPSFCFSKPLTVSSSQGGAECSQIRTKKLAK